MSEKKGDLKRLIFYDTSRRHVELKIRLDHDDMTQSEFFRALDDMIVRYLKDYRETNSIQSKSKTNNTQKLINKGKDVERKFSLNEDERDNIFDLIAEEHPEL